MVDPRPVHIVVDRLAVDYSSPSGTVNALRDVSLEVRRAEIVCLLGPSGCGKSTLLNAIAGFLRPSSGQVLVDDHPVGGPAPERGYVLQQHALFPWMTVEANVGFGPRMQRLPRNVQHRLVQIYLERVGLTEFRRNYPRELSGGMQQRVGIARALAARPAVLLMDEPFGSLDAYTRVAMRELLLNLWEEEARTIVFVTHDVDEAILVGDRMVFLTPRPGTVQAVVPVDLPRPRIVDLLTDPGFLRVKREALGLLNAGTLYDRHGTPND